MKSLIAKIEAAPKGSRELSLEIDFIIRPQEWHGRTVTGVLNSMDFALGDLDSEIPYYSTSLDAMASLARTKWESYHILDCAAYAAQNVSNEGDSNSPPDLWPCIQAGLVAALKIREGE